MAEKITQPAARRENVGFDSAIIEDIKARLSLQGLIGQSVKLTRHGHKSVGCCPFHDEKSASFNVYNDHYHCFGCGAHGDLISFVQKKKGSPFFETIKELASLAGVTLPAPTPGRASANAQAARLKEALRAAGEFYAGQLRLPEGRDALAYLVSRGATGDDIQGFRLGWAPSGGSLLVKHLRDNGFTDGEILGAGLARKSDRGPEIRDFFFGRVMFPIANRHGDIVSFGGRSIGDAMPKYINGGETQTFKKSKAVYGFDRAAPAIRKLRRANLVEGYLDVVAMHRVGIANTVAPMGTAVTLDQIEIIWREAPDVVICLDGDKAGISSAIKLCENLLPKLSPSRRVHVAIMPAPEDPDSLIAKGNTGVNTLKGIVENPQPISAFMFEAIKASHDLSSVTGRAAFRAKIRELSGAIVDQDLAGEWEEASIQFVAGSLNGGNGYGAAAVDERVAEVLIGSILLNPSILTEVEDMFTAMPVPTSLSGLKGDICHWWMTSQMKTKEDLKRHLKVSELLEAARGVATTAFAHIEKNWQTGDQAQTWTSLFLSRVSTKKVEEELQVMRSPRVASNITFST